MHPEIERIIENWLKPRGFYSFESRFRIPDTTNKYPDNPDFLWINFIIEVSGFFLDEEHTKPIKLHYERLISIDKNNSYEQYHEDLRRDLNWLESTAYAQFDELLHSYDQPIYTSDPLHMR